MENENKNEIIQSNVIHENNTANTSNESDDKKKHSKFIIIGLIVFLLLIVICVVYFIFTSNNKSDNKDDEDYVNNVTQSDEYENDGIIDDVDDDNVEIENNIINIYQKGYAENGPIAFTYECKSENCDIKVIDKGFILYDEEVVKYREMTSYEYEQINNSEISPIGSKLDMDGFAEVYSIADGSDEHYLYDYLYYIYYIDGKLYEFGDVDNDINNLILIDDEVMLCEASVDVVYNLKLKKIITSSEPDYLDFKKVNDFYLFALGSDSGNYYVICNNEQFINAVYVHNGYYIYQDVIYYITYDGYESFSYAKLSAVNSKNEKISYNTDGIKPIHIFNDKLIYLNENNILSVKNLLNDENIYSTGIKMDNAILLESYNDFKIFEIDNSVLNDAEFDEYRKTQNISNEEFDMIKKCKIDNMCEDVNEYSCYSSGYLITLDKNGKYVSKDYYLSAFQACY